MSPVKTTFVESPGKADASACAGLMSAAEPWLTLGRSYQQCLSLIEDPLSDLYLARQDEKIVGFAVVKTKGPFAAYVQTLLICPEFQGTGLGTRFICFLEESLFRKHPNIFICSSSFNRGALKLYRRLGYEVIGELKDYIICGHSEILLRKTIAPIAGFEEKLSPDGAV